MMSIRPSGKTRPAQLLLTSANDEHQAQWEKLYWLMQTNI